MNTVTLHLLDSIHSWLLLVILLSVLGGGLSVALTIHESDKPDERQNWDAVKLVAVVAAIAFALSTTLAIFLPTPRSLGEITDRERRARVEQLEADKKAAKLAYCIANPGECK